MSTSPRTASPPAIDIAAAVALLAALIYAAGWSYAYHWYDRFNLGLIGLGIPFECHFMYGFWVLRAFWWLVLLVAALLTAALIYWSRVGPKLVPAAPVWVPLAFVPVYWLGGLAAAGDYRDHKPSGFERWPWVRVWTTADPDAPAKLQAVQQDLAAGRYRLLLQTAQSLYPIKPKEGGEVATLQLSRDRVRALRRIPTNPGGR
jgi:hypothetical protein